MKIVAMSDTHMVHPRLHVPRCDLLVHCGDFSRRGSLAALVTFARWYAEQPAPARILVAGNHDFICDENRAIVREVTARHGITYLEDEAAEVLGLRLYGSPITPAFGSWAFQRRRGSDIAAVWARIPDGVELLVTHGPPHGLGDRIFLGRHVGCEALRVRVEQLAPRLHLFGHIHEAHGDHTPPGSPTRYFNVAVRSLLPLFPDGDVTQIEL